MTVRGIRGATVCSVNEPEAVLAATRELIEEISRANPGLIPEDIASAVFTTTQDLTAAYPARAAREAGWGDVPLLCGQEIPVPDGLARCVRVLVHWNTDLPQREIRHVYLEEAATLRPHRAWDPQKGRDQR